VAVREWVHDDFGIDLITLDPVGHGADERAELWRGAGADGAAYAVKCSGGGTPAGLLVSAHLAEHGVAGVPAPVPTRDGRLWSQRDGRRLSVVPWVSDDRALTGVMGPARWTSYGALLAGVHAIPVTDALAGLLPREEHRHDEVTARAHAVERAMPFDHPDPLVRAVAAEWRERAAAPVATLLENADRLGPDLRARQSSTVVCHGDPHLGNVLLGKGDQVWLIDWDDAVLAPPERDLMFVVGGVLAFAPVGAREQSRFFDGYGPVDIDRTRLAYYLCVRALFDIVDWAARVIDLDRWTDQERAESLAIVRGLLSPTGLVTLARSALRELR